MLVLFCFFRERREGGGGLDVGNMWCIMFTCFISNALAECADVGWLIMFTCFIFNALAEGADVGWLIIWSLGFAVLNIGCLIVALDFGICPLQG